MLNKFFLFSEPLLAQAAEGAAPGPSLFEILIMPIGFLLIMYFFIIRPQQRKAKDHANLLSNLKTGDEVVTTGGILGRIRSIADGFITLDVGNNITLKVMKSHVSAATKQEAKSLQTDAAKAKPAKADK